MRAGWAQPPTSEFLSNSPHPTLDIRQEPGLRQLGETTRREEYRTLGDALVTIPYQARCAQLTPQEPTCLTMNVPASGRTGTALNASPSK